MLPSAVVVAAAVGVVAAAADVGAAVVVVAAAVVKPQGSPPALALSEPLSQCLPSTKYVVAAPHLHSPPSKIKDTSQMLGNKKMRSHATGFLLICQL